MNSSDSISLRLQQLLLCLVFYTRLPFGRLLVGERDFAAAQWAAPIAGIAVGLCGGLVFFVADVAALAPSVSAAICLATMAMVTGGLHEDGAADTADGFGGGKTAEDKLQIMRDSRVGTYGVIVLVLSFLLRWAAVAALEDPIVVAAALVGAHSASRALVPTFMRSVPPARSEGLSAGVGSIEQGSAFTALAIGVAALLLSGPLFVVTGVAVLFVWFLTIRTLCMRQIGGQTGDVIGALQQGGEVLLLVIATSAWI